MEICSALLHLSPRPPLLRETLATLKPAPPQTPRSHLRLPSALVPQRADRHARIWIQSTPQIRPSIAPLRVSKGDTDIVVGDMDGRIAVGSAITILFAVANRVLYKLALVPMKEYPFFLAQFTTFGYVVVYFSILYIRYHAGIITDGMLALPKSRFVGIGILEALGVASGMSAGAMLPGPAIPILSQTFLIWQLIFSAIFLGRTYSIYQVLGCLLVTAGVALAVASGADEGQFLSNIELIWPALMVASSALQAGASILKEFVFIDGSKRLQGKPLDIFVVNSFGSAFQGVTGCEGAPFLPLLFVTINMAFNISLLNLVKMSSALVSSLASTLSVPVSIYILSLPLPYIPEAVNLSTNFVIGTAILVFGLLLYNLPKPASQFPKND